MTPSRGEREECVTTTQTQNPDSGRVAPLDSTASRAAGRLRTAWRCCLAGMWLAALAGITVAQTPVSSWVEKTVHGYRIALAVESVPGTAPSKPDPKHASVLDHRLIVSFGDEKTGATADVSDASVDVAELGYKGVTVPLQRVESGKQVFYEARLRLSTKSPHRILVHATPTRGGRTLEAQFEYQHHH